MLHCVWGFMRAACLPCSPPAYLLHAALPTHCTTLFYTAGFGVGSAAAAKAEDEAKQREVAAKTVKTALQELGEYQVPELPLAVGIG